MTYIDLAILSLAERFCQRFQRLTGRTNVWLAVQLTNLSIIMYFVSAAAYFWLSDVTLRIVLALFCGGLLYLLAQTVFKVPVEAYENSAYRRVAKGLRNPRRIRDALLRIVFLTLSIVLAYPVAFVYVNLHIGVLLLSYSLVVLMTVVLYLLACDPLPPCTGWLSEWLRGSVRSPAAEESRPAVTTKCTKMRSRALSMDLSGANAALERAASPNRAKPARKVSEREAVCGGQVHAQCTRTWVTLG